MNNPLLRPANVVLPLLVTVFGACQMPTTAAPAPDPGRNPGRERGTAPNAPAPPRGGGPNAPVVTPLFWSWQPPLGDAANHPNIIQMVRPMANRAPELVADTACDEIVARGLTRGRVCILLQGYGAGGGDFADTRTHGKPALWSHWSDGLAHKTRMNPSRSDERLASKDACEQWWATTWMKHGIVECRGWMDRFIAQYKVRQARDGRIPDPSRFHFDTERGYLPEYTARGTVEAFDAMRKDARWSTEPIPGHDGKTLAQLYAEAGSPDCQPTRNWGHAPNQAWASWYAGVCWQAFDGSMDEAAYQPIRATWSGCLSSNYGTSARFDGEGNRFRADAPRDWYKVKNKAFGDLQAPVLYYMHPDVIRPGETHEAATLRIAAALLDANIHSFGGPHDDVVPWLELNGNAQTLYNRLLTVPEQMMEDLLRLCRSKGVREMIIWNHEGTQADPVHWSRFANMVGRIWAAELRSAIPEVGRAIAASTDLLRRSEQETFRVRSRRDDTRKRAIATRTRLEFDTGIDAGRRPRELEIVLDAWIDQPGGKQILWIRNWKTGEDDRLGANAIGPDRSIRSIVDDAPRHHVSVDGRVEIVIQHECGRTFTSSIDSVHLIADANAVASSSGGSSAPTASSKRSLATAGVSGRPNGRIVSVTGADR